MSSGSSLTWSSRASTGAIRSEDRGQLVVERARVTFEEKSIPSRGFLCKAVGRVQGAQDVLDGLRAPSLARPFLVLQDILVVLRLETRRPGTWRTSVTCLAAQPSTEILQTV